ncbi:MAG TPA: YncE family protein, partial [Chloroflexota bacterium]|nr:YncE family protein [Chloroflexota bacterium]
MAPATAAAVTAAAPTATVPISNGQAGIATIKVGQGISAVAVNPSTNMIYVANGFDHSIVVINGATKSIINRIPIEAAPQYRLAVNPSTNTLYVTGNNSVMVIDGATNQVSTTIKLDGPPSAVAVNPATKMIYVAVADPTGRNSGVRVIDGATNKVAATINTAVSA